MELHYPITENVTQTKSHLFKNKPICCATTAGRGYDVTQSARMYTFHTNLLQQEKNAIFDHD